MKLVLVYWGYENAGSMLDLKGYARAAQTMGQEVKIYGPPNPAFGLDYSQDLSGADAITFVFEWTTSLQFRTCAVRWAGENTLEGIQADRVTFNAALTERVSRALNGYGVQGLQAQLTEFAPCRAFAINGHAAVGQYALWTGF